ncbi:hypothetical protein KAFR_0F03920 [Kazachstania africana CBS 2517]|uniref:5'-3' DNA helicase ZGRF1-like N-terminal domain-containing protein n=1 Tax=Kazachstania africana (strain ATCC 22294 / BCRC 22015 / CBS 2517 / CECT 1963 / NBRC 1671 / NRRL Y-8276) TaxID=1071382 RepID=H2AX88_KAZAF|nr:hypothetical protein KAFR_0F03920 [Kazachstania africana CBS 2517]CCF58988.1 hypothetical protein KAFR_0F03920 [Kazachstania africana CBS 2517]
MKSHITEYSCQYTDQLRKKHKIWHDGKLKYFQLNGRFILYTEADNVVLASEFITSSKDLEKILNPDEFGVAEHHIFSKFLIIISDILCTYDKEVQINAFKDKRSISEIGGTTMASSRKLKYDESNEASMPARATPSPTHSSNSNSLSLALKFNRPFKPPKRISKVTTGANLNRPSIRSKRVDENTNLTVDLKGHMSKIIDPVRHEPTVPTLLQNFIDKEQLHRFRVNSSSKLRVIRCNPIIL